MRSITAPPINTTLKSKSQWQEALRQVERARWGPHPDPQKNWDHLAAFHFILRHTRESARILDAGGEIYSPLMDWLSLRGYKSLHVMNLSFKRNFTIGPIRYKRGNCTASGYPSGYFDAVACLSVIEHGVPLEPFLKESWRILRPGGHLVISTDYWKNSIKTFEKKAGGVPIKIFIPEEIKNLLGKAQTLGFLKTGKIDYSVKEKAVHWNGVGLDYTFIIFALRKGSRR